MRFTLNKDQRGNGSDPSKFSFLFSSSLRPGILLYESSIILSLLNILTSTLSYIPQSSSIFSNPHLIQIGVFVCGCQPHQQQGKAVEETVLGRSLKSALEIDFDENTEEASEVDLKGTELGTGPNINQVEGTQKPKTEAAAATMLRNGESLLLIMAPFAKAFNMTNGDLGINEAPSVRSDRAIVEEILHVETDDSINDDGGVNEGNQFSPDEKLFIDVLERSESLDDGATADRTHVQTEQAVLTKTIEILFPDLTAAEIGFNGTGGIGEDNDGRDVEGVEQVHVDVEIGDNEGLSLEQPTLGVSGKNMPQINIRFY